MKKITMKMLIIPFWAYWVQIFTTSLESSMEAEVLSRLMFFLM